MKKNLDVKDLLKFFDVPNTYNKRSSNRTYDFVKQSNLYILSERYQCAGVIQLSDEQYLQIKAGNEQFLIENNENYKFILENNLDFFIEETRYSDGFTYAQINYKPNSSKENPPPGVYTYSYNDKIGRFLQPKEFTKINEKFIVKTHDLNSLVINFINNKVEGRKNKSGLLLYGRPGNSKSLTIQQLELLAKEHNFYMIYNNLSISELAELRPFFEGKTVVLIQEELTEALDRQGVGKFLTFLDGEDSWDDMMVIATTNYPEELPANLVDRPGRS